MKTVQEIALHVTTIQEVTNAGRRYKNYIAYEGSTTNFIAYEDSTRDYIAYEPSTRNYIAYEDNTRNYISYEGSRINFSLLKLYDSKM
jgi:hypothetical protein